MLLQENHFFEFGDFRADPRERLLTHNGHPVSLTPKAFDVLMVLISRPGHLVTKKEFVASVWGDSIVEEGNLAVTIFMLRKALGDDGNQYIQTVSKQGYRFVGEVREQVIADVTAPAQTASGVDGHLPLTAAGANSASPASPLAGFPMATVPEPVLAAPRGRAHFPTRRVLFVVAVLLAAGIGVRLAMTRLAARSADSGIRSMAVLPFANLSGDTHNDYLGSGIADGVITAFGTTGQVAIRPTAAVLKYGTQIGDPLIAGREQKVDAVLEGQIRASAGRIQVSVHLLRVSDGRPLWSGTFEEDQRRPYTSQSISDDIARAMIEDLPGTLKTGVPQQNKKNEKAYQLYLQGRSYFYVRQSLNYFQQAIAEDPDFALAYSGMADSYTRLASFSTDPAGLTPHLAKISALRALQLGGSLAEVRASLGYISFSYDWKWSTAEQEFKRALSIDSNYTPAHEWYSELLAATGRLEEAAAQAQTAVLAEPRSPRTNSELGWIYYLSRRYDEAIAAESKAIELDPNYVNARVDLALTYLQKGDIAEAIHQMEQGQQLAQEHLTDTRGPEIIAYAQSLQGDRVDAIRELKDLTVRSRDGRVVRPYYAAMICLGLGERAKAMEWLEQAYELHDYGMVYAKTDPVLDPLRSEPQFNELLKRMGL